jgi:hypothetical protein
VGADRLAALDAAGRGRDEGLLDDGVLGVQVGARLSKLASEAETLASGVNPGEAFFAFFTRVVGHAATKNALTAALMEAGVDVADTTAETGQGLKHALATLLRRAQEAGAVRRDIGPPEVMTLLVAASQAAERAGGDHGLRDRAVSVILDGLRAVS